MDSSSPHTTGMEGLGQVQVDQAPSAAHEGLAAMRVVPSPPTAQHVNWAASTVASSTVADGFTPARASHGLVTPVSQAGFAPMTPGAASALPAFDESDLGQDDVEAVLRVHGYACLEEAVVVDLHESGLDTTVPLAVFTYTQVRCDVM